MKNLLTASAVALVASFGAVSAASANSGFVPSDRQATGAPTFNVNVGTVLADAAGTVSVYDTNGELLGTTPVKAGLNTDVRVHFVRPALTDVVAVLDIDGTRLDDLRLGL
ncbi:hypothetical protein [Wenxinia saemankumensis]|uniref:DUF4394 domain-containing protein n=1 Tax=Wenxinia saemankumensis TaxID=1447782 RepID=A0A1M6E189_9RHOB|nr:hypothetical protein [Wenxinia saemankumensis]SHI79130.1 hypothetical protein SAMN05444417_1731 [Wenxinia saemankumensis]